MRRKAENGVNLTIRIPDGLHEELKRYREEKKPHMSLNAIIVEAVIEAVRRKTPETQEKPAARGKT